MYSKPPLSILNELELIPVYLALVRLSSCLVNQHIVCYTDNTQVLSNINTGVSINKFAMSLLRQIFWICVTRNLHLTACHIVGTDNVVADRLSRISRTDTIDISSLGLCCS